MTVVAEILALQKMSVAQLKEKWKEVFGEEPSSRNKAFLWKKLARKIQETEYGNASEEGELASNGNTKNRPTTKTKRPASIRDRRLPMPGTIITRDYKGHRIEVTVLEKGFEYGGGVYRSLSAVADEVTGSHWNGFLFFGLKR